VSHGDFAYWKYHLEFQRFFAVSEDRRSVISVRGMAETNQEKGGSLVPFFDMPWLGSWRTLRGFENYRYRDKSALAVGIEYRYRIWRALDWGFFVDNGQVGPEPGDFSWSGFHTGYGTRFMMLPTPRSAITVDLGRSNEQWRMYINFNPTF
jgi:outer membrane protein assembly factor BamA